MKKTIVVIASAVLLLVACKTSKHVQPVAAVTSPQTEVDRMSSKFNDYTLTDFNNGKTLYEQNCASCHNLKNPASRSETQWQSIVPDMTAKANRKAGKELIDSKSQDLILKYLITMSTARKAN